MRKDCGCEWDGNIRLTACEDHRISTVATPPSDAAPVAWRWQRKGENPDFWHLTNVDPTNLEIAYWRDHDLPKCTIQPLYAHPEDAPGGPTVEHRCGVQGFNPMSDTCPKCEQDSLDRLKGDKNKKEIKHKRYCRATVDP